MAYVFDDLKNGVEGEDPNKGSIFGEQPSGEQAPMGGGSAMAPKTSTEGDFGSSTGGGDSLKSAPAPDAVDQSAVFDRNIGQTETPSGLSNIRSSIKSSSDDLQARADDYVSGYQKDYNYQMENTALDEAIAGGQDEYASTQELLSKGMADRAKDFDTSGLRVSEAQNLETDAGLQKLAGQGQGPQYTQGMGAFDVMLMKRDPKFNQMLNQIRGENVALNESLGVRPGELQEQAQDYGQSQLEAEQGRIKDYLGDYSTGMISGNEGELAAYQAELAGLDREAIGQTELGSLGGEYSGQLGDEFQQDYEGVIEGYNPNDYINYDTGEDYSWKDFLDKTESGGLNRAAGLLGQSDTYTESLGLGDQYSVDKSGLWQDLDAKTRNAYGARMVQEEETRVAEAEAQRVAEEAAAAAEVEDKRIADEEAAAAEEEAAVAAVVEQERIADEEAAAEAASTPQNIQDVYDQDTNANELQDNLFKNLKTALDPAEAAKGGVEYYGDQISPSGIKNTDVTPEKTAAAPIKTKPPTQAVLDKVGELLGFGGEKGKDSEGTGAMKEFSAKYGGQAGVGAAQNMTPVQIERIMKQIADAKQKAADRKKAEEKMKSAIEPLTNDFGRFNNWARRRF